MARHSPAEIAAGAVVLAVAGLFLGYAVVNTGASATGGYTLHADFDHVDGLSPGSEVRIAGVKIGSISAITLDPKTYLADVAFTVRHGVELSTDSSATVATDGLLGGKYLALASGGDTKMLAPGQAITITQGSVNLESLLGKYIFGSTGSKDEKPAAADKAAAPSSGGIAPLK